MLSLVLVRLSLLLTAAVPRQPFVDARVSAIIFLQHTHTHISTRYLSIYLLTLLPNLDVVDDSSGMISKGPLHRLSMMTSTK